MRFSEIYKSCQKTYNAFESLKSELRKAKKRLISNNYKKTMHKTPFFYFFLEKTWCIKNNFRYCSTLVNHIKKSLKHEKNNALKPPFTREVSLFILQRDSHSKSITKV